MFDNLHIYKDFLRLANDFEVYFKFLGLCIFMFKLPINRKRIQLVAISDNFLE